MRARHARIQRQRLENYILGDPFVSKRLSEITRDPTAGVGKVKYRKKERAVPATEERRQLFPDHGYGPWRDIRDSTCFYRAAVTGLLRGEILELRWQHIDFDR